MEEVFSPMLFMSLRHDYDYPCVRLFKERITKTVVLQVFALSCSAIDFFSKDSRLRV